MARGEVTRVARGSPGREGRRRRRAAGAMAPPPTRLEGALRRASELLESLGHRWALIGGLAVSVRAEPRFTRDVDLAVAVDAEADAEQIVYDFQRAGFRVLKVLEHAGTDRLATVRLVPPGERTSGVIVDLLFGSSGIEPEIASAASRLTVLPGVEVPVATTGDLLALKVLARDDVERPQDILDIRALLAVARPADLRRARRAAELIQQRGYNRARDLVRELRSLAAESKKRPSRPKDARSRRGRPPSFSRSSSR